MKLMVTFLCLIFTGSVYAQTSDAAPLEFRYTAVIGPSFYQDDRMVRPKTLRTLFPEGSDARHHYNRHLALSITGGLSAGFGGLLLVTNLDPRNTPEGLSTANWSGIVIGAGLVVTAIPLAIHSLRAGQRATDAYNLTLEQSAPAPAPSLGLRLGTTPDGVGLALSFGR